MPLYLTNGTESLVEFQAGVPTGYDGPILPGSASFHVVKESFQLISQEIVTELYTLRFNAFRFFKKIVINSTSDKAGLHSRTVLKGNIRHTLKGLGKINLREGEFTMLWAGSAECRSMFQKDKEYRTLDIFYSPGLINQLTSIYPFLATVIKKGQPTLLVKGPCWATPIMRDVIRQVLECPFDDATRHLYLDLKIREFLYVMLERVYKRPPSRYRFSAYETACIIKAHDLVLGDLSKKPLSIRELSRAVALNEFKLKAGFQQFYGMGIFECLHEARMEKAKDLLLTTNKPIKEICRLTGYPRSTNFITAFRRKFSCTPGSLRRK